MKKSQVLLSVGIALAIAGSVEAASRTRGGADASDSRSSQSTSVVSETPAAPSIQQVGDGIYKAVRNGQEVYARNNGVVTQEDIATQYGSMSAYYKQTMFASVPMNGDTAANGAVAFDPAFRGPNSPLLPTSVAGYQGVQNWTSVVINGTEYVTFVDGAVLEGQAQYVSRNVLSFRNANGQEVAADGMIRQ